MLLRLVKETGMYDFKDGAAPAAASTAVASAAAEVAGYHGDGLLEARCRDCLLWRPAAGGCVEGVIGIGRGGAEYPPAAVHYCRWFVRAA